MKKLLFLNSDLCTGCLSCQAACAIERRGGAGASLSALRIGFDPFGGPHLLNVCRQCPDAPCREVCPAGAIVPQEAGWAVDFELCVGCLACREACPFSAVFVHPTSGKPLRCDLCGGEPVCVTACKFGALVYGDAEEKKVRGKGVPDFEQDPELGRGPVKE